MRENNDRRVGVVCFLALSALLLSVFNLWFWFGFVTWLLMILSLAIGFGHTSSQKPILYTLLALFLAYSVLLVLMTLTDRSGGDISLLLGLPVATALLVYGIWPLGFVPSVLYFLAFDRSVLSEEKLEKFLSDFCNRRRES